MAKLTKAQIRQLSGNNPRLKIDLKELFGVDFSRDRSLRLAVGQRILDRIVERTQSQRLDRRGKALKAPYSQQYADSDEFQAAGKSRNIVNMTLTGDMLGTLDITEDSGNSITLGWDDSTQAAKAHGHITGDKNGPKVKRDFFGLSSNELDSIKREFQSEVNAIKESEEGSDSPLNQAILRFIEQVGRDDGNG